MKIYKLERAQTIDIAFQMGEETIPVACDLDRAAREYPAIGQRLDAAYKALREADKDTYDERYIAFANVVQALLDLMFGENAEKVAEFYEHKWLEIVIQLLPALEEGVLPAIKEYAQAQQKKLLDMKKGRRS